MKISFLCELEFMHFFFICSFIFLFLENYGVRKLEAVFVVLISTMSVTFTWMFCETKPSGKELLLGRYSIALPSLITFRLDICQSCVILVSFTRYFSSKTELKNHKAGSGSCWLCHHTP